ncbi:MAG: ATP synthase F1 subunit gamma [Planctomycetota bacterium]
MATARDLKNKIRSIRNTRKITRTMEMIATAKASICQKRIESVKPYGDRLTEMLRDLRGAAVDSGDGAGDYPLLRRPERIEREAVFVISANRGLCGGYNTNVLRMAEKHLDRRSAEGVATEVHMVGKKGITRFRYLRREVTGKHTQFDDRPSFEAAAEVLEPLLASFCAGDLDAVTLISTRYQNAARQVPILRPILPIPLGGEEGGDGRGHAVDFIFEPSPDVILGTLLPLSLKMQLFLALVEAAASEQIQRRIAMKNATDNADEMETKYKQIYNRTRQAGITQEILEVLGGSEVL